MPTPILPDSHPDRHDFNYAVIYTRWVLMAKLIADLVYDPQLLDRFREGLSGRNREEIRRRLVDDYGLLNDYFRDINVDLDQGYDEALCKAFWDDTKVLFAGIPLDQIFADPRTQEGGFWAK